MPPQENTQNSTSRYVRTRNLPFFLLISTLGFPEGLEELIGSQLLALYRIGFLRGVLECPYFGSLHHLVVMTGTAASQSHKHILWFAIYLKPEGSLLDSAVPKLAN